MPIICMSYYTYAFIDVIFVSVELGLHHAEIEKMISYTVKLYIVCSVYTRSSELTKSCNHSKITATSAHTTFKTVNNT